jgi:carboxyl-terminal processing protease
MRHLISAASILAVAATIVVSPASLRAQAAFDQTLALETFDKAWEIVYKTHFDTTFNGVDWIALRDELRPRVEMADETSDLRAAIREMLDRLNQSHFALIPKEFADSLDPAEGNPSEKVGDIGFDMRFIDEQMVVTVVDPNGPASEAGVKPGWVIVAVGDDHVADLVERRKSIESKRPLDILVWAGVRNRLQGDPGSTCTIEFLDGDNESRVVELTRRPEPGEPVKLGNLPTFFARFATEQRDTPEGLAVGVIWFNAWMVPLVKKFDRAVDEYRGLDGMVIDLRGNGGGVGSMVMGLAGHFTDERIPLGVMRTRSAELNFFANPRRVDTKGERVAPYAGPVAILTDGLTGSASEMFAGGMQAAERVRVFGDTTMGGVLPASMSRLPNGDVLYHAFGEFETADGTYLEGRGVYPDEPVSLSREALLTGRDEVLLAAMRWIAGQRE